MLPCCHVAMLPGGKICPVPYVQLMRPPRVDLEVPSSPPSSPYGWRERPKVPLVCRVLSSSEVDQWCREDEGAQSVSLHGQMLAASP